MASRPRYLGSGRRALHLAVASIALMVGCADGSRPPGREEHRSVPGGDAARGGRLIRAYGCGACHHVPGVAGANGRVAPNLAGFARQQYLAGGIVANDPERLVAWIEAPRAVKPDTAMPTVGLSRAEAADIAAFLYTLD